MSDFPEDLFQQLYRRAPTDVDRDRLVAAKSSLGLSARDEMWPVIMTLDHYTATNQSARNATIKEMKVVLEALKAVPASAGPVAIAEAQKAVATAVEEAAEKIAKVAVQKSETRADRISKRKLIVAMVVGATIAAAIAAASAVATYFVLDAKGICAEPVVLQGTTEVCIVDRSSG